jgi:hypothetical protein
MVSDFLVLIKRAMHYADKITKRRAPLGMLIPTTLADPSGRHGVYNRATPTRAGKQKQSKFAKCKFSSEMELENEV